MDKCHRNFLVEVDERTRILFFLKGGAEQVIPEYKSYPKNSPFVPAQRQQIEKQRSQEDYQPKKEQPPIVEFKMFQAPKPPMKKEKPMFPGEYPANFPVPTPWFPMSYMQQPLQYPMIKNYNLSLPTPMGDHMRVSTLYEDILPSKEFVDTSMTIGERLNLCQFVRSVLVKQGDGESMNLGGSGNNNLMSYVKLMELNPYHYHHFYDNPYRSLPSGMMLYRSCYPVRYDTTSGVTNCARNSIGMNLRLYKMTVGDFNVKRQRTGQNFFDYELWREIAYYEHIRDNIIKKKICPNFIMMFSYYINERCGINFDDIQQLRGNANKPNNLSMSRHQNPYQQTVVHPDNKGNVNINLQSSYFPQAPRQQQPVQTIERNPNANSGNCLIALTEAPTYNIYTWASKIYQANMNVRKMVNTGYHNDKIWGTVLFQLLSAMYVLQNQKIAFRDMKLQDNVYIKDLRVDSNVRGHWRYKIDGLTYYIPNYGFLLLVDSNYKDIIDTDQTIQTSSVINIKEPDRKNKIYSTMFNTDPTSNRQSMQPIVSQLSPPINPVTSLPVINVRPGSTVTITPASKVQESKPSENVDADFVNKMNYQNLQNLISPNNFSQEFVNHGGVLPSENIKKLMGDLSSYIQRSPPSTSFGKYILECMRRFLHNRIGNPLKDREISHIQKEGFHEFKKGDIVVHQSRHDDYIWVCYLDRKEEKDTDIGIKNVAVVLTKADPSSEHIIESEVPFDSLLAYSRYEKVEQEFKAGESKLTEEDLLETYVISEN
jgi:hypothetical protein